MKYILEIAHRRPYNDAPYFEARFNNIVVKGESIKCLPVLLSEVINRVQFECEVSFDFSVELDLKNQQIVLEIPKNKSFYLV